MDGTPSGRSPEKQGECSPHEEQQEHEQQAVEHKPVCTVHTILYGSLAYQSGRERAGPGATETANRQ